MKIINLKKDKWTDKYSITFENNDTYKLSIEQIVKYELKEDMDIDYEYLTHILREENKKQTFNKALDLIAYRDHSSKEIKDKLTRKGYDNDSIEEALNKLDEYNFINDEKYAINYSNYSLKNKKNGKNKIIYELKQKGIPSHILNSLEFDEEKEYEVAKDLCYKKLNTLRDDERKREKLYRYLSSKGFTHTIVVKIIQSIEKEEW